MKCGLYNSFIPFKASISNEEIDDLKNTKQHFSDCYLMTSLETLAHTENGRKILKEHIKHDDNNYDLMNCYLYNPQGKLEKYSVSTKTALKEYEKVYKKQDNDIIRSMDISVNEYEKKYHSKPMICKISANFKDFNFEYNLPSHFLKMLTGIEPTVNIAETDYNIDLTSKKEEVMKLFERMDKDKNHSLLIATGVKKLDGHAWHVYVLEDVDLKNNTVTVKEKRSNTPQVLDIETALKTFKYIVGYFNEDLDDKE